MQRTICNCAWDCLCFFVWKDLRTVCLTCQVFCFVFLCFCFLLFVFVYLCSAWLQLRAVRSKIVCPDQIYCKWGRAPPRAPGILSPCIVLYFIKGVFCSVSGGEGDWLCNVRAHICHKYHKLYFWRKNCHVKKFLRNFEKFWEILPQFTRFHVEKIEPKKYICGEKWQIWGLFQ